MTKRETFNQKLSLLILESKAFSFRKSLNMCLDAVHKSKRL